jgi:hypothetical protein
MWTDIRVRTKAPPPDLPSVVTDVTNVTDITVHIVPVASRLPGLCGCVGFNRIRLSAARPGTDIGNVGIVTDVGPMLTTGGQGEVLLWTPLILQWSHYTILCLTHSH